MCEPIESYLEQKYHLLLDQSIVALEIAKQFDEIETAQTYTTTLLDLKGGWLTL